MCRGDDAGEAVGSVQALTAEPSDDPDSPGSIVATTCARWPVVNMPTIVFMTSAARSVDTPSSRSAGSWSGPG